MPINFSDLATPSPSYGSIDPIELFQSGRITDPQINDLWLAQGDALREWNRERANADIAIVLNTGAGKTLAGLLAAQSLVNETKGKVVYACSSIQLVRQTAEKAQGYGLDVSTYYRREWSNKLYDQSLAPCITTYQALFNGRSTFFDDDIEAVIFDDAHSAGHIIRDQFTLRIPKSEFGGVHESLYALFRSYFTELGRDAAYTEAVSQGQSNEAWFVPPFVVKDNLGQMTHILTDAGLRNSVRTMFAWEHLRNHIELCAVFISGNEVTLTPPFVPVGTLPYFQNGVRRLYLSATLSARDSFMRDFGRLPNLVIAPQTAAGECERLILVPALVQDGLHGDTGTEEVDAAKPIISGKKSLVITPSGFRKQLWTDVDAGLGDDVAEQVEAFRLSNEPQCLVLTARYDGVDLPGDTCRVLVIDDLPTGLSTLERFLWEKLGMGRVLRSTVASRVVQSFGRISRGMSDHGVVVITGAKLVRWIMTPKNQQLLPPFLQRQIQVGQTVSKNAEGIDELVGAAGQCLDRDAEWLEYYERAMSAAEPADDAEIGIDAAVSIAADEHRFAEAAWVQDFTGAARAFETSLTETFATSKAAGAWHALWLGHIYHKLDADDQADQAYRRAYHAERNIPPPLSLIRRRDQTDAPVQVVSVADLLTNGDNLTLPRDFDINLAALEGGAVPSVEAALESLGTYLGLESSRPDNELGTGPDVFWYLEGLPAANLEAKTDKSVSPVYRKSELGQLRDHRQWIAEQPLAVSEVYSAFVGPVLPASNESNPDPEMHVIELDAFYQLAGRLRAALLDICAQGTAGDAIGAADRVMREQGLLWPTVFEQIPAHQLAELRPSADGQSMST